MGVSGQRQAPAVLPPGKTRCPLYRWLGGPQGLSGVCGKSRPHRDSIPDRPARSESLYLLSYPGPRKATSSFVITQRLSVCTKQHLSDRTDCREILCPALLLQSVDTFRLCLCPALLLQSVDTFRLCLQPDIKKTLHTNVYRLVVHVYTDDRRSSLRGTK